MPGNSETTTADAPQDVNENSRQQSNPPLHTGATRNDLISREYDGELKDKSYEDGSPNEICVFKLDQGKIDELTNDYYRAETCVSPSGGGGTIQNKCYKEMVKSDGSSSRNEDEFRCKSSRERKTHHAMPDGVIIIPGDGVRGVSRGGITIGVISLRDPMPKTRKRRRPSTWRRNSKRKWTGKVIDSSALAVLYADNGGKTKGRSAGRECGSYRMGTGRAKGYDPIGSMRDVSHPDVNATIGVPNRLENGLNERQELCAEDNLHPFCMADRILDSCRTCNRHDDAPMNVDQVRQRTWNEERTYLDARNRTANFCCSAFNDEQHQECRVCDRENYNAADFDLDAVTQMTDWTTKCVHLDEARAREYWCCCDLARGYYSDVNAEHCCWRRPFENFASSRRERPREEKIERFGSDAPEFATEANECCPEIECSDRECTNCDEGESSASATRECMAPRASVFAESSERDTGLRGPNVVDAARFEIAPRARKRERTIERRRRREDEWPNKSDSQKVADTRDARANGDCTGRCWRGGHLVAMPLRSGQSTAKTGGFVPREMNSKWKHGSIETDVRQLDYKRKRRIATVDANTRMDFAGERDSRLERNSKNVDCKCDETRDSLWTSLRMDKIWSRIHDACKNTIRLATTSVDRAVKNVSRSEQRNLVEVTDAARVENLSLCADEICEETCRKNLIAAKEREISKVHEKHTIENVEEYREDTDMSVQKNSMAITSSPHDMRVPMCQNKEQKNGKTCVIYNEDNGDRYRDVAQFLPRNGTYSQDESIHPRSPLNESFVCLKDSVYLRLRNRGGSDDNRNLARNDEAERKSVQRRSDVEEAMLLKYRRDSIARECACYPGTQESRNMHYAERRDPRRTNARHESSMITYCRAIQTDGRSNVSRGNPHREFRPTSVSLPEDNGRTEVHATSGTTTREERSPEKEEAYGDVEYVPRAANSETESNLISRRAEIADATVSSTEAETAAHSSRNESNEPIPSTSERRTAPFVVTSSESRENRPASGWPSCATAMRFWRKRPAAGGKVIASAFRRRRSVGRKRPSIVSAGRNSGTKITQIEQSTVQTAREGNKTRKRTCVNVRAQTSDAIVTRILSEFLVSGEKKRRIIMTITLESEPDRDISDREEEAPSKEAGTQTLSNDVASVGVGYPTGYPPIPIATASRTIQCFVCDKQDCYEIKPSDDSIAFEEALIAEYPEVSEFDDRFAERRTDLKTLP